MSWAFAAESDVDLRARVLYVSGDGPIATQRIASAEGARLDELAEAVGLKRRKL